jgi:hypothetical protein
MWMVRVTHSRATAPGAAAVERYTAVELDADDHPPGVHPLLHELGRMRPATGGSWLVERTRVEAVDGEAGREAAAAVYQAARGFLALRLAPTGGPTAMRQPDRLQVEVGDASWSFPLDAAPAEAWAVLRVAQAMHAGSDAA